MAIIVARGPLSLAFRVVVDQRAHMRREEKAGGGRLVDGALPCSENANPIDEKS